jgi:hypothetical protein
MNNPFTAFLTNPDSGIYLRLDIKNTGAISEDILNPFVTVDVTRPFTSVMKAKVVTSSGSVVKEVFMMTSRDEYLQYGNLLEEVTNKTLDESWQRIIKSSAENKNDMLLSDRTDPAGAYLPFDPVFYCIKSKAYFTPVCPACSSGFDVCRDEPLLRENGLASYSKSLKRYLYCPECQAQGRAAVFYASSKGLDDPKDVKDRQALIQGFVNLLVKADSKIPCSSCEHRTGCYGEDWLALNNIVSLSFYPFYAVLNEAGTINAADFLQLLSGASYEEVEDSLKARGLAGRLSAITSFKNSRPAAPLLLFETDDRAFLEILYLKLSFAADFISRNVRGSGGLAYPDLGLGPESMWVMLPDNGGFLPAFWNFRSIYLRGPETEESFRMLPSAPNSYFAYFFGRLFVYALISNPFVEKNEIDARLKEALNAFIDKGPLDPELLGRGVFKPENIFYKPEGRVLREEFSDVFKDALSIGVSLMLHGYAGDGGFPEEEFISSLNTLKKQIRKMLFAEGHIPLAVSSIARVSRPDEEFNAKIIGILDNIRKKWLDSEKTTPLIVEEPAPEEAFEKTIVIPVQKAVQGVNINEEPEDFHETIILNAATLSGKAGKTKESPGQKPEPPVSQKDLLEETIMMSQNAQMASKPAIKPAKTEESKTGKQENKDDELSETVIIKK